MAVALLCLAGGAAVAGLRQSGTLTAGDMDDNLNFEHFLDWKGRALRAQCALPNPKLDLSDRIPVGVAGSGGVLAQSCR